MPLVIEEAGRFLPNWTCSQEYAAGVLYAESGDCDFALPEPYLRTQVLTLDKGVGAGETLLLFVLFARNQATRATLVPPGHKFITDDLDPTGTIWQQDRDPTVTGLPSGADLVLECWRRPVVVGNELPAGSQIRISQCYAARAYRVNQPIAYFAYQRVTPPNPGVGDLHDHNRNTGDPSTLYDYTDDQFTETVPTLGFGFFWMARNGHDIEPPNPSFPSYEWPLNSFDLDQPAGVAQSDQPEMSYAVTVNQHSGVGGPVFASATDTFWYSIGLGWKVLIGAANQDWQHFRGIEGGFLIPPNYPGYVAGHDGYHFELVEIQANWYSVVPDTSGLWPYNLYTWQGHYYRTNVDATGRVWVRRSYQGQLPFDLEQAVTTGPDERPTLCVIPHHERLNLFFERIGTGVMQTVSDDDAQTWATPELVMAGARFPLPCVDPEGNLVIGLYFSGGLFGILVPSGEAARDRIQFTDQDGANLAVEEDTFGLAWRDDNQSVLVLTCHIAGEDEPSEWECTDGGEYFRFKRAT